jgi:hypothetical protein
VLGPVLSLVTGHGRSREEANEDGRGIALNKKGQKQKLMPKRKLQHEPSNADAARTQSRAKTETSQKMLSSLVTPHNKHILKALHYIFWQE